MTHLHYINSFAAFPSQNPFCMSEQKRRVPVPRTRRETGGMVPRCCGCSTVYWLNNTDPHQLSTQVYVQCCTGSIIAGWDVGCNSGRRQPETLVAANDCSPLPISQQKRHTAQVKVLRQSTTPSPHNMAADPQANNRSGRSATVAAWCHDTVCMPKREGEDRRDFYMKA